MKTKTITICFFWVAMTTGAAHADELNVGNSPLSKETVIKHFSHGGNNSGSAEVNGQSGDYEGDPNTSGRTRMIDLSGIAQPTMHKSHSTHKTGSSSTAKLSHPEPINPTPTETALSMEILFPYNSAVLTDAAKEMLKPIGEGLASKELQNLSFAIEGYTDAVGGAEYNKTLSEQRAESVKTFLIGQYAVDSSRLIAIGKGESALLKPDDPYSPDNRRVRIVAKK